MLLEIMFSSDTSPRPRGTLLLVAADDSARRSLQLLLQGHGFDVHAFASAEAALADGACDGARFLLLERCPSGTRHVPVLETLRARGWQGRAVLIAAAPAKHGAEGEQAGFAAVIRKPVRPGELLSALAD